MSAPDEERMEEADWWSDAINYLRLYDKKKELHVFAVNMKNIKEVHEKRSVCHLTTRHMVTVFPLICCSFNQSDLTNFIPDNTRLM